MPLFQQGFSVNENGEILGVVGSGSNTVVDTVAVDFIPVDSAGRMLFAPQMFSGAGGFPVVNTVTDLLSVSVATSTFAFVLGYYAARDGGGGAYKFVSGTAPTAGRGGVYIVDAPQSGYWELVDKKRVHFRQFGVKGDSYVTDDTTAIKNALSWGYTTRNKLYGDATVKSKITSTLTMYRSQAVEFGGMIIRPDTSVMTSGYAVILRSGTQADDAQGVCRITELKIHGPQWSSSANGGFTYSNASNLDGLNIRGNYSSTGSGTAGNNILTVTADPRDIVSVGDTIYITNAGTGGNTVLTTTVTAVTSSTLTLANNIISTVSSQTVTDNLNYNTSSDLELLQVLGFRHNVVFSGMNNYIHTLVQPFIAGGWKSNIKFNLSTNSGENIAIQGGRVANAVNISNSLSYTTTGSITSGSQTLTVSTNPLGILSIGDYITVPGQGWNPFVSSQTYYNNSSRIIGLTSTTITVADKATTTSTNVTCTGTDIYCAAGIRTCSDGSNVNVDIHMFGVSVDFNDLGFLLEGGRAYCYGCHLEDNTLNPTANLIFAAGKEWPTFAMYGGTLMRSGTSSTNNGEGASSGRLGFIMCHGTGGHYRVIIQDTSVQMKSNSFLFYVTDKIVGEQVIRPSTAGNWSTGNPYRINNLGSEGINPTFNNIENDTNIPTIVTGWTIWGGETTDTTTWLYNQPKGYSSIALTGTISTTVSTAVVGVGTKFLTEVNVGDYIKVAANADEYRKVASITDDTHLTLVSNYPTVNVGVAAKKIQTSTLSVLPASSWTKDTSVKVNSSQSMKVVATTSNDVMFQALPHLRPFDIVHVHGYIAVSAYTAGTIEWSLDSFASDGSLIQTDVIVAYSALTSGGSLALSGAFKQIPAGAAYVRQKVRLTGFTGTANINALDVWKTM